MRSIAFIATGLASLFVTGCANVSPPSSTTQIENGKSYWMSYDASRRGSIVISNGSVSKSCSEPAPDVALSFVNTLKGTLAKPGGLSAEGVDASFNATALALAGRDDVVLLAREALFRVCEAHLNGSLRDSDVKPLFNDVFQQVKEIAVAQAQNSKSKAEAAKAELEITKLKAEAK
jgi:hypothetical protein